MAMINPQDFDDSGHLLPMRQLPEAAARALASFEVALKKIRLGKVRALESLAKYHDLVAPDRSDQAQVHVQFSDEQVARLERLFEIQATSKPIAAPVTGSAGLLYQHVLRNRW